MLKTQTDWFMAVGRDRDQRRCQLLSRLPIPPAPLPPLPGTQHQSGPPGPSGGMPGILSAHLLSALLFLTPVRWKSGRRVHLSRAVWRARGGNEGKIKANWLTGGGERQAWQTAESESSWTGPLSFCQHNKDQIVYFCRSPPLDEI